MFSPTNLELLPKIKIAQNFEQLSYLNLPLKLKSFRQIIAKQPNQRQTQNKSLYWIELKIYKSYTIAVLKIDRYEGMFKFKNQKSKQQHVNHQEIQMFQKIIDNIVKKQEIRGNKLLSIWLKNGAQESFQKEIRFPSDIKQYLKYQKKTERPEQFIFTVLFIHQIMNSPKSKTESKQKLRNYLKIYYSIEKQYMKPVYRMLFPNYKEDQYLFQLNIIFLHAGNKQKVDEISNLNKNETVLFFNINPTTSYTDEIKTNKKTIYYYEIVLHQQLSIERIKSYFMKFVREAEMRASINIVSELQNKQQKLKLTPTIKDKLNRLIKLNSNKKQFAQLIKSINVNNLDQNKINQVVERIQILLQSNQEANIWQNILEMWNDQFTQKKQNIQRNFKNIGEGLKELGNYQNKLQTIGKQIKNCIEPLFMKNYISQWKKLKTIKQNKFKLNNKKINVRIPDVSQDIIMKIIQYQYNCRILDSQQIQLKVSSIKNNQIQLNLEFKQDNNKNKPKTVNKSNYKQSIIELLIYVYEKQQKQQELSDLEIDNKTVQIQQTNNNNEQEVKTQKSQEVKTFKPQEVKTQKPQEVKTQKPQKVKPLNNKTQKLQLWNDIRQLIVDEYQHKQRIKFERQILIKSHGQEQKYYEIFQQKYQKFKHRSKIQPIYQKLKNILLQQIYDFAPIRQKLQREAKKIHKIFQQEKEKMDRIIKQSNWNESEFCFQFHLVLSSNIPPIKIAQYKMKEPLIYFIFEWNNEQNKLSYSAWNFNYVMIQSDQINVVQKQIKTQILKTISKIYSIYLKEDEKMLKFQNHLFQKVCFWKFNQEDYQNILTQHQLEQQKALNQDYKNKLSLIKDKLRIHSYEPTLQTLLKRIQKDEKRETDQQKKKNPLMILQYDESINLLKIKNYKQQIVKLQYCHNFSFRKIKQKIIYMILDEYYKIQRSIRSEKQKKQLIEFNKKRIQRDRLNYLNSPQGKKEQQLRIAKIQAQQQLNKKKIQLQQKRRKEEEQQKRRQQQQKKRQELQKQRKQQEQKRNKKIIKLLSLFSQFRIQVSDNSIKQYLTQFTNNYQYKIIQKSKIIASIDLLNLLQKYFEQELNSVYQKMKNKELQITVDQNQKLSKIIGEIKKKCNIKLVNRKESLLIVQNNNDMIIICKTDKSKTKITQISMDQDQNILIYNILKYYKKEEQLYEEKLRIKQEQEKQRIRLQNQQKKKQQQLQRLAQEQQKRRKAEENNKIKTKLKNILKIKIKREDDWKILQQNIKQISDQYKCELKSQIPLITVHYKSSQLTIESDYSDKKTYNITITNKDEKFQSIILQEYLIISNLKQEYMKKLINQIPNQEIKISITGITYMQQRIKKLVSDLAVEYKLKLNTSSDPQMMIEFIQMQKRINFKTKNNSVYMWYPLDDVQLIVKKYTIPNYILIREYEKKKINIDQCQQIERGYQAQIRKNIEVNFQKEKKLTVMKAQQQFQQQRRRRRQIQEQERSKREQEKRKLQKKLQEDRLARQLQQQKEKQDRQQRRKRLQAMQRRRIEEQKIKQQSRLELNKKPQIKMNQLFSQKKKQSLPRKSIFQQQLNLIAQQQYLLNFRVDFFPEPNKESQLILKEIQRLGFQFNKMNPKYTLNLIMLKNMHDRGGLDLLDSQLNYKFQQLKSILSTQHCLFFNVSPKCYLTNKTFKQSFSKRLILLGHQLDQRNIDKYAQFVHFEINILDKKLKYPSSEQQFKNILKRLAKKSNG